ncbi:gluconate 2-dehydrogenase subunit 3 family protein [Mariniflexile sp. AS56]|uniref:gluconate 2-dehydrogenase subunit 3 family protein n=1 Tax=Mariniflexile sp. AS56 TaxID=3063957 RepID=UPI0026E980FB|nr:gluconate 2-dehydrogenase subunit 3 family protein [Mariniflexile sp. AS56]MDO7170901.1 gluconate 2-dehydrogenase subunit 3 family protein [Mariniflexile sp. AS56]
MKRRDVLKNLGLATGFFVATPGVISLLQSCTSEVKTWVPEFLNTEQGVILKNLVNIILPKTENLPSATELNIPQFIDTFMNEVLDDEGQTQIKTAFSTIVTILKTNLKETEGVEKLTETHYKSLLDTYMLVKGDIDEEREGNPESLEITKSEFLNNIKWMTINAYINSEEIGKNVLVYDPVPAQYYCGDLEELTNGTSYSPTK